MSFESFMNVDIRSGLVIKVECFPRAKKPAYKIWVDFGKEIGIKQTSAQVTHNYTPESLVGKAVMGAINLGSRNIAGFMSEFLLLGFEDGAGEIILAVPDKDVPKGKRLC